MLSGQLYCFRNAVLEVEKWYESRYFGRLRKVRCYSYRYAAWVTGGHPILRYHNVHRNDSEYHHRVFDPLTGAETGYETLYRYQFPLFTEGPGRNGVDYPTFGRLAPDWRNCPPHPPPLLQKSIITRA